MSLINPQPHASNSDWGQWSLNVLPIVNLLRCVWPFRCPCAPCNEALPENDDPVDDSEHYALNNGNADNVGCDEAVLFCWV
jgi:hypothetical protein